MDVLQPDLADRPTPDLDVGVASHRVSPMWSHTTPGSIEALQVVYKVAERCNINCTYCYYFNMGEDTALTRPANATSAERCDSTAVSRVSEVENAKTSGRILFCRRAAARMRCR